MKYYDIGLNLFCKQFRDPEKIINDAAFEQVSCILTGSDMKSSEAVNNFVKTHNCHGTCGIHPHSADSAKAEDFQRIREIVSSNDKIVAVGSVNLILTACSQLVKIRYDVLSIISKLRKNSINHSFCTKEKHQMTL